MTLSRGSKAHPHPLFTRGAYHTRDLLGSHAAFLVALTAIALSASLWWMGVALTEFRFLGLLLLVHAERRRMLAFHLKLDELNRAIEGARLKFIGIEDADDEALEVVKDELRESKPES